MNFMGHLCDYDHKYNWNKQCYAKQTHTRMLTAPRDTQHLIWINNFICALRIEKDYETNSMNEIKWSAKHAVMMWFIQNDCSNGYAHLFVRF